MTTDWWPPANPPPPFLSPSQDAFRNTSRLEVCHFISLQQVTSKVSCEFSWFPDWLAVRSDTVQRNVRIGKLIKLLSTQAGELVR